jgi:hypothetical protein
MSNGPVPKLWENHCCYMLVELLGEGVAGQAVAGRVVPYVERPSAKALGESLLRELLDK